MLHRHKDLCLDRLGQVIPEFDVPMSEEAFDWFEGRLKS